MRELKTRTFVAQSVGHSSVRRKEIQENKLETSIKD